MSSSEPATPARSQGGPHERVTPREEDGAGGQPDRAAQKAMVRARMFGTAAATIGRYAILEVLGAGGMGTVYACFDDQLDRRVALKLVQGAATEEARLRMLREARVMAKLSHPNVVPVFEVGEHLGRMYVAMEYVRGSTLRRWQSDPERTWAEVLDAYHQAGRGLAAAHAQGLVHRDFKPHNAMVGEDERVRVLDFGLATRPEDIAESSSLPLPDVGPPPLDTGLTETGRVLGTPAYMAPEQAAGEAVDPRSDQYAFCVALWEGLYGARPSPDDAPTPADAPAGLPPTLAPVLSRGLSTRPEDRWPSMDALLDALDTASRPAHDARPHQRRAVWLMAGGGALLAAALVGQQQLDQVRARGCRAETAERSTALWNDDTRTSVEAGLRATDRAFATVTAERTAQWLDTYVGDWRDAHTEACLAARVDQAVSNEQDARVQWCLQERALAFESTVARLANADAAVATNAVSAVSNLPDVGVCRDADALKRLPAPPSGDAREAIAQIRSDLVRASTLVAVGQHDAGLDTAREAADQAQTLGDPPLIASASLTTAKAHHAAGALEDAERDFTNAYFLAIDAADLRTAGLAATALVSLVGVELARPHEGLVWVRHAQAAWDALELPEDDLMVVKSVVAHAQVLSGNKGPNHAKPLYERVYAIREAQLGPDHPLVASSLHNLAAVLVKLGSFAEATTLQTRGLAINEHAFGPDHPVIASDLNTLAVAAASVGDFAGARTLWTRALGIRERALGPTHPDLATAMDSLGALHGLLKEWDQALVLLERALAIREVALGPAHPGLSPNLLNLAAMYVEHDRRDDARAALERAVAILDAAPGASVMDHAELLGNLGVMLREDGDWQRAKAQHARAIALLEAAVAPDHPVLAREQGRLAAALAEGGELIAATKHANRALKIFAGHDGDQEGEFQTRFLAADLAVRTGADRDEPRQRVVALKAELQDNKLSSAQALLVRVDAWLAVHAP